MNKMMMALVLLCVLLGGGWGYQRMESLSERLTEAQASLQTVQDTMTTQKQLDATRVRLDQSVRELRGEIQKTNDLTRRLFDATNHTTLPDPVIDGLHKGCTALGVACLPK